MLTFRGSKETDSEVLMKTICRVARKNGFCTKTGNCFWRNSDIWKWEWADFSLEHDDLYQSLLNGKIHQNFMGYSSSKTQLMIGLGMSAISDSWYAFAQNEKSVEEYENLVNDGILPVVKGHILNKEDLTIRQHILNIMCRLETSWNVDHAFPEIENVMRHLQEMREDGLVEISDHSIKITEKGRAFTRNVAMAFDLRLIRNKPETRIFSMTI